MPVRDAVITLHERLHEHARGAVAAHRRADPTAVERYLQAFETDNRVLLSLLYAVLTDPGCGADNG